MPSWWKQKRIDLYLAAVIVPSIILAILALWALVRQYYFISYQLKMETGLAVAEGGAWGSFGRVSIFAFAMIIFALLLILLLGSYLSSHDVQRQVEVAKLKSDFVSTVSHELKTPLTSIRLLAERLLKLKPEEQAKQREYHSLILTQSYQLSHLIENVLNFSKLEQEGKENYKFESADLAELIKEAINKYPVKLTRPDCKLNIDLATDLRMSVDKQAIARAFINLLDNALKFSPQRGVIAVSAAKMGEEAVISVADQGPGIAAQEKHKIFQRFYHKGKGSGLGLNLVQHIAQGHGGRVEFESQEGKGSKFKIILPIKKRCQKY